ncbi:DUF3107 domain-containing protein [Lapillicoccus sp.]|uniref:DUF3107 domain-containing protein n=1 Tax=Lapillicoccus sp. TaxID=1909287 RepID=UPI0025FCFF00|nr:DUF3107 domain-containing protein [Lapillicoccus sp.]
MEVRIGVQNVAREIAFESNQSLEEVTEIVNTALVDQPLLRLTDDKGRVFIVPVPSIGYINIGEQDKRGVGFGTS